MGKLEGRTFNANGVFDGVEIENRIDEYEKWQAKEQWY
jgi:hypothetical protein